MIAGGIGITPFMAQTAQLGAGGGNFELHYACRTASLFTYGDVLSQSATASASTSTTTTAATKSNLDRLLRRAAARHAPLCVRAAGHDGMGPLHALSAGWPMESLHSERFLAPASGAPYEVRLALGKTDPRRRASEHA